MQAAEGKQSFFADFLVVVADKKRSGWMLLGDKFWTTVAQKLNTLEACGV